jgi:hypothetical protein
MEDSLKDVIHAHEKTGSGLASEIVSKKAEDGTGTENKEANATITQQIWHVNTMECMQIFCRKMH